MCFRPCAAKRATGAQQIPHFVGRRLVALEVLGSGEKWPKADQIRNAPVAVGEKDATVRFAEAESALAKVVANSKQVVDLGEAAPARPCGLGSVALATVDQPPPPAVRRAVGEGAEQLSVGGRVELPLFEWEAWVERVSVTSGKVVGEVAEGR